MSFKFVEGFRETFCLCNYRHLKLVNKDPWTLRWYQLSFLSVFLSSTDFIFSWAFAIFFNNFLFLWSTLVFTLRSFNRFLNLPICPNIACMIFISSGICTKRIFRPCTKNCSKCVDVPSNVVNVQSSMSAFMCASTRTTVPRTLFSFRNSIVVCHPSMALSRHTREFIISALSRAVSNSIFAEWRERFKQS